MKLERAYRNVVHQPYGTVVYFLLSTRAVTKNLNRCIRQSGNEVDVHVVLQISSCGDVNPGAGSCALRS